MIRAEAREGDARCEWERMERSLEITARQYLSDFHLYYLNGLVWSCCNFLATKGYLCYSEESRIFSHPGLMEEILTRETIQIKYALRRTVRICTKESRGSCHTMNIWNQGYFFFFFFPLGASENTGPHEKQDIKLSCWFGKWYSLCANEFFVQKELNRVHLWVNDFIIKIKIRTFCVVRNSYFIRTYRATKQF